MMAFGGVLWHPPVVVGASSDFHLVPNALHVTESFRGAPITVSGEIRKGADALVEITGPVRDVHLLQKGRRGGLWMSVGEVEVNGAPSVYLAASTDADLSMNTGDMDCWGYAALAKQVTFSGTGSENDKTALFNQFAKLKESQGLYGVFPGGLHMAPAADGRSKFEGQLKLPSNVTPGTYQVTLSVIDDKKVSQQQSIPLFVDMTGLAAFLTVLATKHGVLYGLLAVGIALIMGFVMGFVFKGKGAH
jgi:hypothetical protein